jgi:steroid delta-isomerase-like uncharacterized protein
MKRRKAMSEDNKKVVLGCWEAANRHDVSAFDRFYAENAVYYDSQGEVRGRENIKAHLQRYMTAAPDLKLTVEDIFGEGDRVFTRVRMQGTHTGALGEIPPTGRSIDIRWTMNACRLEGGKIVEEWEICDTLDVFSQLGLIQAPAPVSA